MAFPDQNPNKKKRSKKKRVSNDEVVFLDEIEEQDDFDQIDQMHERVPVVMKKEETPEEKQQRIEAEMKAETLERERKFKADIRAKEEQNEKRLLQLHHDGDRNQPHSGSQAARDLFDEITRHGLLPYTEIFYNQNHVAIQLMDGGEYTHSEFAWCNPLSRGYTLRFLLKKIRVYAAECRSKGYMIDRSLQ